MHAHTHTHARTYACTHARTRARTHAYTKYWVTICECCISWPVLSWQADQTKCPICSLMAQVRWMRSSVVSFFFSFLFFILFAPPLLPLPLSPLIHSAPLFLSTNSTLVKLFPRSLCLCLHLIIEDPALLATTLLGLIHTDQGCKCDIVYHCAVTGETLDFLCRGFVSPVNILWRDFPLSIIFGATLSIQRLYSNEQWDWTTIQEPCQHRWEVRVTCQEEITGVWFHRGWLDHHVRLAQWTVGSELWCAVFVKWMIKNKGMMVTLFF